VVDIASLGLVTSTAAAERLGIKRTHLHRLILSQTLRASKAGNTWLIAVGSLDEYEQNRRRGGRPRKEEAA
jgi:excisionase family DNA binding protein